MKIITVCFYICEKKHLFDILKHIEVPKKKKNKQNLNTKSISQLYDNIFVSFQKGEFNKRHVQFSEVNTLELLPMNNKNKLEILQITDNLC